MRALIAVVLLACGCSQSPSGDYSGFWSGVDAATSEAPAGPKAGADTLAKCPTKKCLTVVVAPWCPHCREAQPIILATREFLRKQNIHTSIVVGMDKPRALAAYAKEFGPDTMIDEDGALGDGGVPHFYVTDASGRVLRNQPGFPPDVTDARQFAALLGLP